MENILLQCFDIRWRKGMDRSDSMDTGKFNCTSDKGIDRHDSIDIGKFNDKHSRQDYWLRVV